MSRVPILWDEKTLSWNAICRGCKQCVFMVTAEAIHYGPRRATGTSELLPVLMTAPHECEASNGDD